MSDDILKFKPKNSFADEEKNFKFFGKLVATGELSKAKIILRELLSLSPEQAEKSTIYFAQQLENDPSIIMKTMQIREKILAGEQNAALLLIQQVFNLQGPESIIAHQKMATIVKGSLS